MFNVLCCLLYPLLWSDCQMLGWAEVMVHDGLEGIVFKAKLVTRKFFAHARRRVRRISGWAAMLEEIQKKRSWCRIWMWLRRKLARKSHALVWVQTRIAAYQSPRRSCFHISVCVFLVVVHVSQTRALAHVARRLLVWDRPGLRRSACTGTLQATCDRAPSPTPIHNRHWTTMHTKHTHTHIQTKRQTRTDIHTHRDQSLQIFYKHAHTHWHNPIKGQTTHTKTNMFHICRPSSFIYRQSCTCAYFRADTDECVSTETRRRSHDKKSPTSAGWIKVWNSRMAKAVGPPPPRGGWPTAASDLTSFKK